jgi:hypothetical protein
LDVVLLLFIIDFVTISFSTDNVRWSKKPEIFDIKPLVRVSVVVGILMISFGIIVAKLPLALLALLIFYIILASILNDFIKVALSKR